VLIARDVFVMMACRTLATVMLVAYNAAGSAASDESTALECAADADRGWPPVDKQEQLLLGVGIKSADGTMIEIAPRGAPVPMTKRILLTTSRKQQTGVSLHVMLGNHLTSRLNKNIGTLGFDGLEAADKGLAQILLRVDIRASRLRISARDMLSQRSKSMTLLEPDLSMVDDEKNAPDETKNAMLPAVWRFENPYTSKPHPGYSFGGKFLKLHQRLERPADVPQENGDVVPSFTANKVWPAAFVMSAFLEELHAKTGVFSTPVSVLELGAGTGLVGLSASVLGAAQVTLSDLSENLPLLQSNAELNTLTNIRAEAIDWTKPVPASILEQHFDIVIAADCVFWEWLFEPLINTLLQLLSPTTRVMLSMTHRFGRTEKFLEMLAQRCTFRRVDGMTVRVSNTDIYEIFAPGGGAGTGGGQKTVGPMGAVEAGLYARAARRTPWGEPI
jgi:2-polyprenyl-3-methyl-5-hydroxy-6-metoxy-1,4-benzoquinol methylase